MSQRLARQAVTSSKLTAVKAPENVVQRQTPSGAQTSAVPLIVGEVLHSAGEPLDRECRAFMEPRFGHDFSRVRVHTDPEAAASAAALHAEAYTVAGHIVFAAGRYRPGTDSGRLTIAHELTHVIQQGEGSIPSRLSLGDATTSLERRADLASRELVALTETSDTSNSRGSVDRSLDASGHAPRAFLSYDSHVPPVRLRPLVSRQDAGEGVIQRRRVPEGAGLSTAVPTGPVGLLRARTGLARVLSRAWAQLTPAQQATVRAAAAGFGIHWAATEAELLTRLNAASRAQLIRFAQEIRTASPTAVLGDPSLIDVGARPATADAANITSLVAGAESVFATIAGGGRDADITQVFGAANVALAKSKYANARTRMHHLKGINKIVTDRSGYSAEVNLGGLSDADQISVSPGTIDHPAEKESVVTMIHESMHAGNSDVSDLGYIHQPSFVALTEAEKLTNAAHFEVVPRRILGANSAFSGVTFVPAGTTVGGVSAPALTPRQQAIRAASERYRFAWTAALNLHSLFVRLFRTPSEWNSLDLAAAFGGAAGARFSNTLPYWSKVEMLTMHTRRPAIDPAGAPAVRPVTLIDIALSEGLTRKLAQGMRGVPQNEVAAQTLETNRASAAERTAAAASVDAERDLLIRLVIRTQLGSITGDVSRDERVIARLAQAGATGTYADYFQIRSSGAFT